MHEPTESDEQLLVMEFLDKNKCLTDFYCNLDGIFVFDKVLFMTMFDNI